MLVKYIGHDPLLLTEYNGKKYAFHKNQPIEIDEKIFKEIILSGHISSIDDVVVVEEPKVVEKPKETIIEKAKAIIKPKDKRKK